MTWNLRGRCLVWWGNKFSTWYNNSVLIFLHYQSDMCSLFLFSKITCNSKCPKGTTTNFQDVSFQSIFYAYGNNIYQWFHLLLDFLSGSDSVKNLPAMQGTQVLFLGWEDPLEKRIATHSSILACRIPWTEEPGGLRPMRSQRVRHDWATNTYLITSLPFVKMHYRSAVSNDKIKQLCRKEVWLLLSAKKEKIQSVLD